MWNLVVIVSQVFDDHVQARHLGKPCSIDLLSQIISKGLLDMLDHLTLSFNYFSFCRFHHTKTPKSNRLVSGEFTGCVVTSALTPLFFNSSRNSVSEKKYSHQRHKRQHNGTNNTPLGFLLGLPVELSNGIAVQEKQQSNVHTQGLQGHPNWLLGRFCTGNRT